MDNARVLAWIRAQVPHAAVARVEVVASGDAVEVYIYGARVLNLVGYRGETATELADGLRELFPGQTVQLRIVEVDTPELEPLLIAASVLRNVAAGVDAVRAMERLAGHAIKAGAWSCRIELSGAVSHMHQRGMDGRMPPPADHPDATATDTCQLPSGPLACHVRVVMP